MEEKVTAISRFQHPILVKDHRHFFGKLNFYQLFKPQAASLQAQFYATLAGLKFKGLKIGGLDTHHDPHYRGLQG
jgi:hypothetical protein